MLTGVLQKLQRHSQEVCIAIARWRACLLPTTLGPLLLSRQLRLVVAVVVLLLLLCLLGAAGRTRLPGRQWEARPLPDRSSLTCRLPGWHNRLPWLPSPPLHRLKCLLLFH